MPEKKPLVINFIIGLIILRILTILATLGVFYVAVNAQGELHPFLEGARQAIVDNYDLGLEEASYEFGKLIGYQFFPAALALLTLIFVVNRNYWGTVVVVGLDLVTGLSQGFPIVQIIILALTVANPANNYLRNKPKDA